MLILFPYVTEYTRLMLAANVWIHGFENITSIIFCTALSDYGQVLLEESKTVRPRFLYPPPLSVF